MLRNKSWRFDMKMMSQVREQQNNNIWTPYLLNRASFADLDAFVNLILPLLTAQGDIASLKQWRKVNDRKRQMTLTENRRRLVVRELTHLISKPNTKIKPRITSEAVIRVLTRFKRELRAMEMESRHAWATMAQLVAAVRPHVLNLRDSVSALRARHEFFVEKTSSEPRKYFHFADVASPGAARDLVLEALIKEMQGISLMSINHQNEQQDDYYCDIFMNANLSSLIWGFLNSNDLGNFGLVSKSFDGARELGKLMAFYSSLENAYRMVTKDFTWLEDALLSNDSSSSNAALDGAIHECIFSQRKVADCIVQMYALYLPTTDRNDDHRSLASTSPVSTNLANQTFQDKETQSSGNVNRGGLLVRKRKEFGGKEEVPDPT